MLLAFLLVAGIGGVVGAGILMPAVGAVGTVSTASTKLFDDLPSELAIAQPSEQSVILAADGSHLATFYYQNRIVVGLDQISEHVQHAVVAVEDRRFFDHRGIDPEGMLRAAVNNIAGGQLEGASTLTQQYVKNVLIEAGRTSDDPEAIQQAIETSMGRKLREARLAIGLEQNATKEQILEGYLNIAQFGPSQWGVEAAARHYFGKSAAELDIPESAMLARITQSPAKWDPVRNPENAEQGRNVVLATMLQEGYITQAEYDAAVAVPIADMLNVQTAHNGCAAAGTAAYFCEYVVDDVLNNENWGEDRADRVQMLYRGGLTIHTTLDPIRQQTAYESVTAKVPVNDPSGVEMALSSVEPGTGKIVAMVQNTSYGSGTPEDPGATEVNLNVGLSHGGGVGFQSGSTFKVFTLIEWLQAGHALNDLVDSTKRVYPRDTWTISCAPEHKATYDNATNVEGVPTSPRMPVIEATRRSINLTFIEMANQLDMCNIMGTAEKMGLKRGNGEPLTPNPAAVLGTNTVTPLDMAGAFATLAAGGTYCTPVSITKITDGSGAEVPLPPSSCTQVLDTPVVNGVNHALQQVVTPQRSSTGYRAVLPGRPAAGKTGTANEDAHAWFVGYTPQLAAAVWMGQREGDVPMWYQTIGGQYNEWMFGGLYPAQAWQSYMSRALEGQPVLSFAGADSKVLYGPRVSVPDVVGRSVEDARAILEGQGFRVVIGDPVQSEWQAGGVASTSPAGGARVSPGATVTLVPSAGPPPPEPPPGPGDDGGPGNGGPGNGGRPPGEGNPPGEGSGGDDQPVDTSNLGRR